MNFKRAELRYLSSARPDQPMRVQSLVGMADTRAVKHLKKEARATRTDCTQPSNLSRCLSAMRVDGRLEKYKDVVVEVAG